MKYPALHYAKAFAKAFEAHPHDKEKLVKNFVKLIEKNGDTHQGSKILAATEQLLRPITGARSITFITARPPSEALKKSLHRLVRSHDVVRENVDPSLMGGVKILINEEEQFDGSLLLKINKLFSETHNL